MAVNGYQVASTNVAGATPQNWRDLLIRGLAGVIDVEVAQRIAATGDRADVVAAQQQAQTTAAGAPLADTLRATLSNPTNLLLLGVAGVLGVGLVAGWFR